MLKRLKPDSCEKMTKFSLKYIETCALPFCRRQIPSRGIDKQDLKLNLYIRALYCCCDIRAMCWLEEMRCFGNLKHFFMSFLTKRKRFLFTDKHPRTSACWRNPMFTHIILTSALRVSSTNCDLLRRNEPAILLRF